MALECLDQLKYTENKLKDEITKGWSLTTKQLKKVPQKDTIYQFIEKYCLTHTWFCQFIQTMLATPPNTSPVEQGYSKLEMVCDKRCRHVSPQNLETLRMLPVMNLVTVTPVDHLWRQMDVRSNFNWCWTWLWILSISQENQAGFEYAFSVFKHYQKVP